MDVSEIAKERRSHFFELEEIDDRLNAFMGEPSLDEVLEIAGLELRRETIHARLMVLGAEVD